jgi:hypothetical protein
MSEIPPLLYEQPVSERCAVACQHDECEPSYSEPYGCGSCCRCKGLCYLGQLEKRYDGSRP